MNVLEKTAKKLLGVSSSDDTKHLRTRNAYRVAKARMRLIKHSYPRVVTLEPTTQCNSKCEYCPRLTLIKDEKITVGDIDSMVFIRIVHNLANYCKDIEHVDLAGFGEPLLDPQIFAKVKFMRETLPKHTKVQITTNGIALTEDVGKRLIDAKLDRMLISLNSFSQQIYAEMNGVNKFSEVLLNIVNFLKLKGDKPPATKIQIMDTDANRPLMNHFQTFWKPMLNQNDSLFIKGIDNMGVIDSKQYDSREWQKKRHPCFQLWQNLLISKEGDCYPCCIGEVAGVDSRLWIGNVMEQSLGEILNDERLKAIRKLHKANRAEEIPLCAKCDMWRKSPNAWVEIRGKWR